MLRKNVAAQVVTFNLVNATTGAALTGATVTTKVALDGTQAASGGTLTELGTGQYKYVPTQAETNGGSVGFSFTASNAVPVNLHCFTLGQDPALATLDTNVTKWLGTAASTPTVAGVPNVNTKTWNDLVTVALPLIPATAGRTLVVDVAGLADANAVKVGPTGAGTAQTAGDLKTLIDAVDNFVDTEIADIQARLPAALVGGRMDGSVGAMAANVVTAAAINANAITAATIADGAIDRATFAADTGLQSVRSNTAQAGAAGTLTLDAAASATDDFYNGCLVYLTGATGAGQARVITGYVGATKVATITPNWATTPDATSTFAVLAGDAPKVDSSLQVTTASVQGNVTGSVGSVTGAVGSVTGAVGSVTGAVGSVTAGVTLAASAIQAIWDAATAALTTAGSIGKRLVDYLTGDAYARLGAPAGASVSADVAAVKGDTAAILVDTGTTLDGRLPAALVSGRMDSSVGAYAAGQVPTRISTSGTADSGSTTTVVDTERTEADTDYWAGCLIRFTSGTLTGQTRLITAFTPATDTLTFAPALTIAAGTHTYEILPMGRVDLHFWLGVLANALVSGRVDASVGAMAANVLTATAINADAITDAKVAADVTIASVTGAVGSVSGAVGSVTAAVLLSAGTGAGQLDFTSGVVKANLAQILGTALTETAGLLAGGFKKFFNIATPASTMDVIAAVTNLTNAPTAGDLTATMKTSVKTQVTDALTVDTYTEATAVPAATSTLKDKLNWLFLLSRNKITQTSTTQLARNDADAATVGTSTVSDDGTTYVRGKFS